MQYENREKLIEAINDYSKYFLEIPNDFDVRPEYLIDNISKSDFVKSFKDYRDLIFAVYKDMAENPDEYDFTTTDKKGNFKNTKQPIQCIMWLMYALGKAGEVKNRALVVSAQKINEIFAGKHDCILTGANNFIISRANLFSKLTDFGFKFSNSDSDFDNIQADFTLEFDKNPNISVAIKAFTLSWYADESFNCDYSGFNYHVFSVGFNDRLPYKHLYISTNASEKTKNYIETLTAELDKLGYKYKNIRHHNFTSNVWMYRCCFFYQNGDNIWINVPLHYVPKHNRQAYLDHLVTMPEKYRSRKRCTGCRKECVSRVIETIDGKKAAYCGPGPNLQLHNLNQIEDIPYIVELIKVMFQRKT